MRPRWTGKVVGKMHVYDISVIELSKHMGISHTYISSLLTGKRKNSKAKENITRAIDEIVKERKHEADTSTSES